MSTDEPRTIEPTAEMVAEDLATQVADTIADLATKAPAIDILAGDPAPSRRQVAAVFRTLADHTHNEHMVDIATTELGVSARLLPDYFTAIAEDMATGQRRTTAAVTVAGQHVADRILDSLARGRGDLDVRGEPRPTKLQVAAVLSAMADPDLVLPAALMSDEVFELGASRDQFGPHWQRTTGVGRFFHALADDIVYAELGML